MADKQAEIAVLQAIVTGATMQSISHRIQGLVFGSQGFSALAEKYAEHAEDFVAYEDMKAYIIDEDGDLQDTVQDLDLIELIGLQNWLALKV